MTKTLIRSLYMISVTALVSVMPAKAQETHPGLTSIVGSGARANAMGGAFIAIADDATAASWNPAGLAKLIRPEVSLVYENADTDVKYRYRFPYDIENERLSTFESVKDEGTAGSAFYNFAAVSLPINVGKPAVVQASYRRMADFAGLFNPYTTRSLIYDPRTGETSEVLNSDLYETREDGGIDNYSASLATQIATGLLVGLTANYLHADVKSTAINAHFSTNNVATYTDYDSFDYRFNDVFFDVGVLWSPTARISVGAVYHSSLTTDFHYDTTLAAFGGDLPGNHLLGPVSYSGKTTIEWPDGYGAGIAFRATDLLTFAADYSSTRWSHANVRGVSRFSIDCPESECGIVLSDASRESFPSFGATQEDATAIRIGAEFIKPVRGKWYVPLRAGYFEEKQLTNLSLYGGSSVPKYTGITLGSGVIYDRFQLDFAYVPAFGRHGGTTGITLPVNELDVESERWIVSTIYRF